MSIWYFRIALVLGVIAAAFGTVEVIKHWGAVRERERTALADAKTAREQYDKQFQLSTELETQLAQIRAANEKLKDDLDAEIAKNRAYRDCIVPVDGVRLYNAALAGATASR